MAAAHRFAALLLAGVLLSMALTTSPAAQSRREVKHEAARTQAWLDTEKRIAEDAGRMKCAEAVYDAAREAADDPQ